MATDKPRRDPFLLLILRARAEVRDPGEGAENPWREPDWCFTGAVGWSAEVMTCHGLGAPQIRRCHTCLQPVAVHVGSHRRPSEVLHHSAHLLTGLRCTLHAFYIVTAQELLRTLSNRTSCRVTHHTVRGITPLSARIASHGPSAYQIQSPVSHPGIQHLATSDYRPDALDMNSLNSSYARHSGNIFRLRYWPAFEVFVHALPQEKVQELDDMLSDFVSGLQAHSKSESEKSRYRSARSLSCPPMGAGTIPLISSTSNSAVSKRSPDLPQLQQSNSREDDRVRVVPSLPTKGHPYNQKYAWRKPPGQEEGSDKPQNMQVIPCDALIQLPNQQLLDVSLDDSDGDGEVFENDDFGTAIDFLATLRQFDPQRALELERQYDVNIAELGHDN